MQIKKIIYMLHFRNFFVTRGKNQPSLIYAMTWVKNTYILKACVKIILPHQLQFRQCHMDTLNALLFIAYISKT